MIKFAKLLGFLFFLPIVVVSVKYGTKHKSIDEILHSAEKNIPTGQGLLIAYLTLPDTPPPPPECMSNRGLRRLLCVAEKYCSDRRGRLLNFCIAEKLKEIRSAQKTAKREESVRVLIKPEKIELEKRDQKRWVSLDGKWSDKKQTSLNIVDTTLNEKIAAGTLSAEHYSAVKLTFDAENLIQFRKNKAVCTKKTKNWHDCLKSGWETYPLSSSDGASEISVIIPWELFIAEKASTEISIEIDPLASITAEKGKYFFKPILRAKNIVSPAYHDPELPTTKLSDDGQVKAEFPEFAITEPKNFSIHKVQPQNVSVPLPKKNLLISAYQFLPDTVFDKPVKLIFSYDKQHVASLGLEPSQLPIQYLHKHKNAWFEMPIHNINTADNSISVYTKHFTIIAISGGTGFRLSHETGVAGRIDYNFLKYYVQKLFPIKIPEFISSVNTIGALSPFTNGPVSGFTKTDVQQKNILNAHFEYDVKPHATAPNKIIFQLKLREPVNFGSVKFDYTASPNGLCQEEYNRCADSCGNYWIISDICRGANCANAAYFCGLKQNLFSGTSSASLNYSIKEVNIGLVFSIQQDTQTGGIRFKYLPSESIYTAEYPKGKWILLEGNVASHTDPGGMATIQLLLVNTFMNDYVNQVATTALNDTMVSLTDQLNHIFADMVTTPGQSISLDYKGILFKQKMVVDFENIPEQTFRCSTPPNIPIPPETPPGSLNFPANSHFGTGFSLNSLEQMLAEIANRGYFCYNGPVGTNGDFLQITPTNGVSLDYGGGYVLKLKIPVSLVYTPFMQAPRNDSGTISIRYRIKPGIALRNMGLEFLGLEHSFTDTDLKTALDNYQTILMNYKTSNPEAFGFSFDFPEPVSFSGIQPSMYVLQNMDKNSGLLLFDYKIQGLQTDYPQTGNKSEWIWTKDWETKSNGCYPHLTGILQSANLQFTSGQYIDLVNNGIPGIIFNHFQNQSANLQGRCDMQIYQAENIIDDMFLFSDKNLPVKKESYVPQLVTDNYIDTTGLFALNITGDSSPELLQIRKIAPQNTTLTWYLDKNCCQSSYGDVPKDTISLPAIHETEGLYKILVVNPQTGYDRLRINEKEYEVHVTGTAVSLVEYLPIRDLVIENSSFEMPFTWDYSYGFQSQNIAGNAQDGNFSLQVGTGISQRELGNSSGHLKTEDHEVGGKYTLSFYYKTAGPETYLGPDPNMECPQVCNPPPLKGCWRPYCVPGDVPKPVEHNLMVNLVVYNQGQSCVYGIGNKTSENIFSVNIPSPLTLTYNSWQKIEQEFTIPQGKCGLNIEFTGITHTSIQLDNFKIVWEKQ